MLKKIVKTIGVITLLLVFVIAIAPRFFDINKKIKPRLIAELEKHLQAQVSMGDINLSLAGGANLKIDSLKIQKNKLTVEIFDLILNMPYSVLTKDPREWMKKIEMDIKAREISINEGQLEISDFDTEFIKEESVVKLKNTKFRALKGMGQSHAVFDLTGTKKSTFEFEVREGTWPADKLKAQVEKKSPNIKWIKNLISKTKISDRFDSIKGSFVLENGVTNIIAASMTIPRDNAEIKASGTISKNQDLKINGDFVIPLDNVPEEVKAPDGRATIPFKVLGTINDPKINWEKIFEHAVEIYSKDEGKKIIKEEMTKLKEKLMKNEKIKELIKGIKF